MPPPMGWAEALDVCAVTRTSSWKLVGRPGRGSAQITDSPRERVAVTMDLVLLLPWLIGIVIAAFTAAVRRPRVQDHRVTRPVKPVWPFILMTVLSLPIAIALSYLMSSIGGVGSVGWLFVMGLFLAILIGGVTMVVVGPRPCWSSRSSRSRSAT